jgi:hypothetical protein
VNNAGLDAGHHRDVEPRSGWNPAAQNGRFPEPGEVRMFATRSANTVRTERRRTPRVPINGDALIARGAGVQRAQLSDASYSGVGVRTADAPFKGEPVRVLLTLDGNTWLDLVGVVRHVRPDGDAYRLGVDISGSDRHALERFRHFVEQLQVQRAQQPKRGSGEHRLVRDASGGLASPGQVAAASPAPPAPAPTVPRDPRPPAAPTAAPRPPAPAETKANAATAKPASRTRTRTTLIDRDLAALYRAAVQDVSAPSKKPKKG